MVFTKSFCFSTEEEAEEFESMYNEVMDEVRKRIEDRKQVLEIFENYKPLECTV